MGQVLSWGRRGIRFGLGRPSYSDGSFLWALTRRASKQPVSTSPRGPHHLHTFVKGLADFAGYPGPPVALSPTCPRHLALDSLRDPFSQLPCATKVHPLVMKPLDPLCAKHRAPCSRGHRET